MYTNITTNIQPVPDYSNNILTHTNNIHIPSPIDRLYFHYLWHVRHSMAGPIMSLAGPPYCWTLETNACGGDLHYVYIAGPRLLSYILPMGTN